jgi:hypothetical protein
MTIPLRPLKDVPESFLGFTVSELLLMGVLKDTEIERLNKKHVRLNKKRNQDLHQTWCDTDVERHLETLEPGKLFKHRDVWEAVGVESYTRIEVLTSLRRHKENFLCDQVRKGHNNFHVFWTRVLNDEMEF